jgi:hypothetical protein
MVNESVCIVIALVQKAVSDHKPAIAATFRLTVQKMFAILPWSNRLVLIKRNGTQQ